MTELMPELRKLMRGADVLVGHNVEFDVRMLLQSGVEARLLPALHLCTWCCARHLWPDAPKYSNQTLRYWKELDVRTDGPSHRALPDAAVTEALLLLMLNEHTPEHLIHLTTKPVLQSKVGFGKHRGTPWSRVDTGYLRWLLSPNRQPPFDDETRYAAQYWLTQRGQT